MEPWTVFKWVRRIVFSFVAISGLIWAILLSVYLSKAWSHSTALQRAVILAIICVYGFSSVLLYLMVVVVFRMWGELLRMLFLLALHISPAVLFTMDRYSFSCASFDIRKTCDLARLVILCVVWAISGILLIYTVYLCIMSCVPRPSPPITPNDLLTGSMSPLGRASSRAPSMSSVKSATGLLDQPQVQPYSLPMARPANRSPSARTIPKKLFIETTDATLVSPNALPRARRDQQLRRGVSYGAMGSPAHPRPVDRPSIPATPSVFSSSSVATPPGGAAVSVSAFNRRPSTTPSVTPKQLEEGNARRAPQRSPQLGVNPFKDAPPRNPSPESFYSQLSMRSTPANPAMGGSYNPFSRTYDGYVTPYFSYSSNGSLVSIPPHPNLGKPPAGRLSKPSMPYMASSQSSSFNYPGTPPNAPSLTTYNASVHSLVRSLHLADPHAPPDVPDDITPRPHSPYVLSALSAPPAAHMRAGGNDPIRRPSNPRAPANGGTNGMPYGSARVESNPYGTDIKRYGSMPGPRSGNGTAGAGYGVYRYFPGGTGHGYVGQAPQRAPAMYTGQMANGVVGANNAPWREMVMRAASGS